VQGQRAVVAATKLQFRADLDAQLRANVEKRRNQPISGVERQLNKDLLEKVGEWKLTGRVDVGTARAH